MRLGPSGARRRRVFRRGDLEVLLLHLLTSGPRHGYDLTSEIEALAGSQYTPSPGTLYPALKKLEANGLVTASAPAGSRKRMYALTEAGSAKLIEQAAAAQRVLAALASAKPPASTKAGDQLRAALSLLKAAIEDHANSLGPQVEAQLASRLSDISLRIRREAADADHG